MSVEDETWDRPICAFCDKEIPYGEKTYHKLGLCWRNIPKIKEEKLIMEPLMIKIKKDDLEEMLVRVLESAEPSVPYSSDRVLMLQDAYKARGDTLLYLQNKIRAFLNITN